MNAEELDHLLETADWDPDVDPVWAEASRNRQIAHAKRSQRKRRCAHVWALAATCVFMFALVVGWVAFTKPLRYPGG